MFHNREYIYSVYKEQSFTKAAEKLHISPPALSAMVKRIEEKAGMPIFNRKTTPISLTSFGAEFIRSIEAMDAMEHRLHSMAYELQTAEIGQLLICASNLSVDYRVSELIATFKKRYPGIKISTFGTNTLRAKQMLDSGEADIFITARPLDEREYTKIKVFDENLVLVVPKSFAINESFREYALTRENMKHIFENSVQGVSLSAFQSIPFILATPNNYLRSCVDMLFREAKCTPNVTLEADEATVALNYIRYGIGAAIVSHQLLEESNFETFCTVYKLKSDYALRSGYAYYKSSSYVTPAMSKFLALLEEGEPSQQ